MKAFKYQLEPYRGMKTRYDCPSCGAKKNFARYIDMESGQHLGAEYGRCNSEVRCGYHLKPDNTSGTLVDLEYEYKPPTPLPKKYIEQKKFYNDHLFAFLTKFVSMKRVREVYEAYKVSSTNQRWYKSTVFYQFDENGVCKTGKIMNYDPETGKRVKKPYSRIYWVHKFVKEFEFQLEQCLFGQHLLKGKSKDTSIYIVESEKTAIIASIYYSGIWVATGGLSNINRDKMAVLMDFDNVTALPDKGAYEKWQEKLQPLGISVINLDDEEDLDEGDDIADKIIRKWQKSK